MELHELMEMIDEEYGHAYYPDFYDDDVKTVARFWLRNSEVLMKSRAYTTRAEYLTT